jgi:hypothetical protein
MSETTQNPYELLDEGARIDLRVCIGAFMLFDEVHVVHMAKRDANPTLTTKWDMEELLPDFSSLDVYDEVRQEFIDKAPTGGPKHAG